MGERLAEMRPYRLPAHPQDYAHHPPHPLPQAEGQLLGKEMEDAQAQAVSQVFQVVTKGGASHG